MRPALWSLGVQHTAFMAICLLSEFNSVFRLAGKLLALARGTSADGRLDGLAAVLATADRATFVLFRCGCSGCLSLMLIG